MKLAAAERFMEPVSLQQVHAWLSVAGATAFCSQRRCNYRTDTLDERPRAARLRLISRPHQCTAMDRQRHAGDEIGFVGSEIALHSRRPMLFPSGHAAEPSHRAPQRPRRGYGCWPERACRRPLAYP